MLEETYLKNSRIPARYLREVHLIASEDDVQVFKDIKNIIDNSKQFVDEGNCLLICSNFSGNGKTTMATMIAKSYIKSVSNLGFKNDTPALFINVPNFMNEKKLAISDKALSAKIQEIENKILTSKLVIFDDIADKTLSEYELSNLYFWVDNRTANMKACIFTTNQLPAELEKTLSGKLYSRVVGYSDVKVITDGDHRTC